MPRPTKRKYTGPTPIGQILQQFLDEKMPKSLGEELRIFSAWAKAVGPEVSRQAEPKAFRNGILFVETRHPVWTTELTAKRHIIQRKLNQSIGRELVRDIHFRQARA